MDPMIQNMKLPQIGLAQDVVLVAKKHAERPLCCMIQQSILLQIGVAKKQNNAIQSDRCVLETPCRETTVFGSHDQKYETTSDSLNQGTNITPYRKTTVFWKRHTGIPLCLDPMIHNIILPQIGLAPENNAMQKGHRVLETPYREPFGSHDPTYNTTSDWLGPGKNAIHGAHCVLETPYKGATVFGSHDQ